MTHAEMMAAARANGWPERSVEELEALCSTPHGRNEFASRAAWAAVGRGVQLLLSVVAAGYAFVKILQWAGV